jgi:uncharacterized protein YkwD
MVFKRNLSAALFGLYLSTGCVAIQANQRRPGAIAGNSFIVTRPPEASYGVSALTCPSGGLYQLVSDELEELNKRGARVEIKGDGRLCAMADTLSVWSAAEPPPESIRRHVAWHFGLPGPVPRVVIANFESAPKVEQSVDADRGSAERLLEMIVRFSEQARAPRFGLQTLPLQKANRAHPNDVTRVVLVLQDSAVDFDPVPRSLPLDGQAKISGRLPGAAASAAIISCDPGGKLERQELQGPAFSAEVHCGERPGKLLVELQSAKADAPDVLARFPIACGTEWSAAASLSTSGPLDAPSEERRLFELLNAERTAVGLPPLTWRDSLTEVARAAAESLRPEAATRGSFDLNAKLREADSASPLVLQNPVAARNAEEAHASLMNSPVNRSNLLNGKVSHAGVGASILSDPATGPLLYAVELLVREQGPVDSEALRMHLREAIARARSATGAAPLNGDSLLDEVALKYAAELAAGGGALAKGRDSEILAPLFKSYRAINIISGSKPDPLDFAQEQGMVSPGALLGVGVAQGSSPTIGKNAVFVVAILATKVSKP